MRKFGSYAPPPRPTREQKAASRQLNGIGAKNPNRDALHQPEPWDPPQLGAQEIADGMAVPDPIDED